MAEYKVKLIMSEEYIINAETEEDAERIARDKFGNNYLIDDVEIIRYERCRLINR